MNMVPIVIERSNAGERSYDIYSRLLQDRIVMLNGEIDDVSSNSIVAQLLYLDSVNHNDISLYINSPGGSISAGMAIYDTMNFIKSDVKTICIGMAASMGAFLLASGCKGKRMSLKNCEVMIHQPLGGVKGQATEIKIVAEHIIKIRKRMNRILAERTGQDIERIEMDTERDNYLDSEEALRYGIIDRIVERDE